MLVVPHLSIYLYLASQSSDKFTECVLRRFVARFSLSLRSHGALEFPWHAKCAINHSFSKKFSMTDECVNENQIDNSICGGSDGGGGGNSGDVETSVDVLLRTRQFQYVMYILFAFTLVGTFASIIATAAVSPALNSISVESKSSFDLHIKYKVHTFSSIRGRRRRRGWQWSFSICHFAPFNFSIHYNTNRMCGACGEKQVLISIMLPHILRIQLLSLYSSIENELAFAHIFILERSDFLLFAFTLFCLHSTSATEPSAGA